MSRVRFWRPPTPTPTTPSTAWTRSPTLRVASTATATMPTATGPHWSIRTAHRRPTPTTRSTDSRSCAPRPASAPWCKATSTRWERPATGQKSKRPPEAPLQTAEPRAAFDPAKSAYQLSVLADPGDRSYQLQVREEGRAIALRPVPGSDSRTETLRAVMTPDALRVAYVLQSARRGATLWAGELADRSGLDRFVATSAGKTEIDSLAWDETGHRLAYRAVRRSGGFRDAVVSSELWVWTWGKAEPEIVFSAPGRYELMGWLAGSAEPGAAPRLLVGQPDGRNGELALRLGFATEADLQRRGAETLARPVLPRLLAVKVAGNSGDVQPENSSVPTSGAANSTVAVRVRVYNNGTTTWTPGANYRLGAEYTGNSNQVTWVAFGSCNGYMTTPTDARVYLCPGASIPPGSSADFFFSYRMPTSAQRLAVRMVRDGLEWFGESWSWIVSPVVSQVNNASIQPANSSVPASGAPNSTINVRVRVVNTGTTTWTPGTNYRLGAEYTGSSNQITWTAFGPCNGFFTNATNARLYLCSNVAPGGSVDFNFTVRVPASGSQRLAVRMVRDGFEWFGNSQSWTITATGGGGACAAGAFDIADYVRGDSQSHRVYSRVQQNGAQEEFAYRDAAAVGTLNHFYFVKNVPGDNWEEFGYDGSFVYRYRDTSWGNLCQGDNAPSFYGIIDSNRTSFAKWTPRCMTLNQSWTSDVGSRVDAGYRNWNNRCDFACTSQYEGNVLQGAKLVAHYPNWTTIWGNVVPDVIEIESLFTHEHFFFAKAYGLVGFRTVDSSFVSNAYAVSTNGGGMPNWVSLCGN